MTIHYSTGTSMAFQALPPQPLSERYQVNLTVQTVLNGTTDTFACIYEPRKGYTPAYTLDTRMSKLSNTKSHLQEIVPGLYVAFADNDSEVDALCASHNRAFSHVVQVAADRRPTHKCKEGNDFTTGARKLRLSCPAYDFDDGRTVVNSLQILTAREFISLALEVPPLTFPVSDYDAKVLVVARACRRVDVMTIIICYLAFTSASHTDHVLELIDEKEELDKAWKGEIPTDYVESMARE